MNPAWFCVRTHSKREHIAAVALRKDLSLETFLPRLRFKRATPRGPVWFTEALFPGYLFVRFPLGQRLLAVQHTRGVRDVVHFGQRWPAIPDPVIGTLQATLGPTEIRVIEQDPQPGQPVEIAGGAFHGLPALVLRVLPSGQRISVLLDFLGRQTALELPIDSIVAKPQWV